MGELADRLRMLKEWLSTIAESAVVEGWPAAGDDRGDDVLGIRLIAVEFIHHCHPMGASGGLPIELRLLAVPGGPIERVAEMLEKVLIDPARPREVALVAQPSALIDWPAWFPRRPSVHISLSAALPRPDDATPIVTQPLKIFGGEIGVLREQRISRQSRDSSNATAAALHPSNHQ